ncbi:MAG: MG2 domain-containing protein, partial [Polyangiales bacterium]
VLRGPMALVASTADDRAGMVADRRRGEGPGSFSVPLDAVRRAADAPVAAVVLDRGAVRPGERVRAKVIARIARDGALHAFARQRVRVALRGPSGEVAREEVRLSNGGTGDATFTLPRAAAPGDYAIAVIRGTEAPMGEAAFQVAEFRTPNARVDLSLARAELTDGDEVMGTTNARYLFGAPISSAPVRWTLRRLGEAERPARWRPFTFSPVDASVRPGTVDAGEAVLERDGTVRLRTTVRQSAPVRERVSLEVSVRDPSGQETSARQTFDTFPAAHEVGLRTLDPWIAHGRPIDIDALVIGHDGNPAPGVRAEVKVYREGWHAYYQWAHGGSDEEGAWRARRDRQREQVHRFDVTSTADVVRTPWTPPQPGTYVIEATLTDAAGHRSVASQRVYAAGPTEHPDRDPPGAPFALTPTRVEWTVGERAALSFECPWPEAEALITVVQSGVVHRERRRVQSGSVSLALPVSAAMIPNAFVTVTLVRPRTGAPLATGALDLGSPDVRWGAAELRVRPPTEPLQVAVQAPAESAPGSDVAVQVQVQNGAGEGVSTEVLLYAVDEGVLRLTRYDTPDPSAALLPRRAPSFSLEDLRRTVISRLNLPALPGASGDGGESFADDSVRDVRDEYDPTPLWMPQLHTDAQGVATATLHLPTRAGQYRVMALAVGDGLRNGRAAAVITARRDVAVRALLPRALTAGDRFEAAALLNNTTHEARHATVLVKVDGEVRATREVDLAADAEVRVTETLEAQGARMDVSFEVAQGTDRATDHRVIPVAPASFVSRRSILGAHQGVATLTLSRGQNTVDPSGVLTVSSRPFLGLDAAAEVLDEGGDAGVVNLAARVITWAALARADHGRSAQWSGDEARQRGACARGAAPAAAGGWRLRPLGRRFGAGAADHRAGDARLVAAGRQGWAVDASASRRALASITEWLRSQEVSRYFANDIALALRLLHDVGADQPTMVTRLFDQREVLNAWGCAELAMAMMPDDPRRATLLFAAGRVDRREQRALRRAVELLRHAAPHRRRGARGRDAGRAARPRARRRAEPPRDARDRPRSAWGDAVSTSFCVDALSRYADLFGEGRALRVTVTLDGTEVLPTRATDDVARYVFDPARLATGDHAVRVQGAEGTFFTALDGRWRTPYGEAEQMARGRTVALHRVIEGEAGRALHDGDSVRLGELLRVRLWVYAEQRTAPFVLVRNVHGGGFEAVDQGFDTTPQSSLEAMLGMGLDDAASDPRVFHAARSLGDITSRRYLGGETVFQMDYGLTGLREYTYGVRATTAGRFLLPPAELRTLYSESTVARSASMTLTVAR